MSEILKELETRVARTYRGGMLLEKFLGKPDPKDSDFPEDWISSFIEAKNKEYIKNEGITRIETESGIKLITDAVSPSDFGEGRNDSGVLIKYLDSSERLGIQVHPTKEYSKKYFGTPYGKTECWHILGTRKINGEPACIYIGFKENVTKEIFKELFIKQDIPGILECMHKFEVHPGDTVLVKAGLPHAIGAGCFLLEIQEPTDYTMRAERLTVGGETLTDRQMHYGLGFDKMLECFNYNGLSREAIKDTVFISPEKQVLEDKTITTLVGYDSTACFKLVKARITDSFMKFDSFVTIISLSDGGFIKHNGQTEKLKKSDKWFIPANCADLRFVNADLLICYPPKK